MQLYSVEGNSQWLDGGAMFGNVPKALWQKWLKPDQQNRIPLACRSLLVEVDGVRLLLEVGIGAYLPPKLAERFGVVESDHRLLGELNRLGFREEDIDFVILSHLHFDHAGGLLPQYDAATNQDDRPLHFPNATYVVGREAYQRSCTPHPRDRASFIDGLAERLEGSNRLLIIEDDATTCSKLPQQISFRRSHGHTPGQLLTVVSGKKEQVMFAGDLVPGTAWLHAPITMGYDRFPEGVIDEKLSLYETVADRSWWLFYTHDHATAMSQVSRSDSGRFEASNRQSKLSNWTLE